MYVSLRAVGVCLPEGSAEFLVVHGRFVLALAPFLSHKLRLIEFELSLLTHPGDAVSCILVCQQLKQELPQLDLTIVAWRSTRAFTINLFNPFKMA